MLLLSSDYFRLFYCYYPFKQMYQTKQNLKYSLRLKLPTYNPTDFLQILRQLSTLYIFLEEHVFMPPFTPLLALTLVFLHCILRGRSSWIPLWNYSTKHISLPASQRKQFAHWIPSYIQSCYIFLCLFTLLELILHSWTWWNSCHLLGKQRGSIVDLTV